MKDRPKQVRRQFSLEFKQKVLADVQEGMSNTAVARKHGIAPYQVTQWKKKFMEGNLAGTPTKREKELERQLDEYKKLLAEAHAEREFLKKFHEQQRLMKKFATSAISGLDWSRSKGDAN